MCPLLSYHRPSSWSKWAKPSCDSKSGISFSAAAALHGIGPSPPPEPPACGFVAFKGDPGKHTKISESQTLLLEHLPVPLVAKKLQYEHLHCSFQRSLHSRGNPFHQKRRPRTWMTKNNIYSKTKSRAVVHCRLVSRGSHKMRVRARSWHKHQIKSIKGAWTLASRPISDATSFRIQSLTRGLLKFQYGPVLPKLSQPHPKRLHPHAATPQTPHATRHLPPVAQPRTACQVAQASLPVVQKEVLSNRGPGRERSRPKELRLLVASSKNAPSSTARSPDRSVRSLLVAMPGAPSSYFGEPFGFRVCISEYS